MYQKVAACCCPVTFRSVETRGQGTGCRHIQTNQTKMSFKLQIDTMWPMWRFQQIRLVCFYISWASTNQMKVSTHALFNGVKVQRSRGITYTWTSLQVRDGTSVHSHLSLWLHCKLTHLFVFGFVLAVFTKRTLLHRLLVCGCACVCPVVVLLLARCLRSEIRSQPLSRPRFIYRGEHRDQAHPPPPARPVPKKRTKVSYKGIFLYICSL